jgi:septal ring factor EnvC (AmiA/AmiB activator)
MKPRLLFLFTLLFLAALPVGLVAQDFEKMRDDLLKKQQKARDEINSLKAQIKQYERQISETERQFEKLEKQYEASVRELALRQQLLNKLDAERAHILEEIRITEMNYSSYEKKLEELTRRYRASLAYLYKHGRTNEILLLLTSQSINQLLARSYYLSRFGKERERQARQIEESKAELRKKFEELQAVRQKNEDNLAEARSEQKRLEQRRIQQENTIKMMEKDRKQLQAKMREVNDKLNNLTKVLASLIREEERIREAEAARARRLEAERLKKLEEARKIRNAKEREKAVARYSAPTEEEREAVSTAASSLANIDAIEKSFISSKGQLPWPVDGGAISARFGPKIHPVYKTRIDNPGIEIAVEPGSRVKAVHDGYVMSVQPIPGFGDVVILNHGRYKSVYGNLSAVHVVKNAPVRKGDVIGLSGEEESVKGPVVFFMIWEKGKQIDPETWITKR